MSKEVAKVLTKARAILEDMGWAQGTLAKDVNGFQVGLHNPEATCFCSIGAICKAIGKRDINRDMSLERAVKIQLSDTMNVDIAETNDNKDTKLIHVLMAFDFAILMAEENEVTV
jgi:hypothetical protein